MTTATATTDPKTATEVESDGPPQWPYRMTYETYEQIAELGMIRPEEHVVLLDGILVQTMTKGPEHHNSVDRGRDLFRSALPPGWSVRAEAPIALRTDPRGDSAPEPDLAVVFGARERYEKRHPEAHEIPLIVEVASSPAALASDRKGLARYAFALIPTVWIVALHDRTVHVFSEPSGPSAAPSYARVEIKQAGELLEAALLSPAPAADQPPAILGPIAVASFFPPTA